MADEATKAADETETETDNGDDEKKNIEKVNVGVEAVPFADLYFAESSTGTIHLYNAMDVFSEYHRAKRNDADTAEITSMCGGDSVEVVVLDSEEARSTVESVLTHFADHIDVATLNENWDLMNNPHLALDSDALCGSCKASWNKAFTETNDYRTVRYDMDGTWE